LSEKAVRLLCDEMLAGLVRWLRAAGHDAALVPEGAGDAEVLNQALGEGRLILTQDKRLAAAAGEGAFLLSMDDLDGQAAALREGLGLDWQKAPFSRCVVDNTPLRTATREEAEAVPPAAKAVPGPVTFCPACGRLYWPGSHHRRMAARLSSFAAGAPGALADDGAAS
jgi:uncharacterized protein with PIN domain